MVRSGVSRGQQGVDEARWYQYRPVDVTTQIDALTHKILIQLLATGQYLGIFVIC